MSFKPTAEQVRARELFATGEDLAIEAGAGTGKTSTLRLLAESCLNRRGQYIAFNKAIVSDAGATMPGSVTASTAHSIAFRAVGRRFGDRLRNARRMRSGDVARFLRLDPVVCTTPVGTKVLQPGYLAGLAMRTITNFCQSADPEPTASHVPYVEGIDLPGPDGRRGWGNNREVRARLAPVLPRAWADLCSEEGVLTYRHDHYLKLAQLEGIKIGADVIYFDEAQDANPVMAAIVAAQDHAQRVWVGDSAQQIYSFTGAVNALAGIDAEHRTFLTQSFRFGHAIAAEANDILSRLEAELRLVGSPDVASVVGPVPDPDVLLTRTNAVAVESLMSRKTAGQRVHLVGGGTEVVSFARAAGDLQEGRPTFHHELACFNSWGEVQDYVAQDEQGGELRLLVSLVDDFGVAGIIAALDPMCPEASADIVISTAHKAKGREWASVALAGDFAEPKEGEPLDDEELRLLYVAVTRARRELDISNVGALVDAELDFKASDAPVVVPAGAVLAPSALRPVPEISAADLPIRLERKCKRCESPYRLGSGLSTDDYCCGTCRALSESEERS